jgi:beta-lactam-binding protein with PASTA domain
MTVLVVAVGAIAAVVVLAFAISRLGGDDGGGLPLGTTTSTTPSDSGDGTQTAITGSTVTPGIMPNVVGLTEGAAVAALIAAGFSETAISVTGNADTAPVGTVYEQWPLAGAEIVEGDQAIIAVSEAE